jgi:mycothiol synthase
MQAAELSELAITRAETDRALEDMIAVRRRVNPRARPTVENLRHNLASSTEGLTYLVARLGDEPVGCGFVEGSGANLARADIAVVRERRGLGIGSALLAEESEHARHLGKDSLQFEVQESDDRSRTFLERRGYVRIGGEQAVSLVLDSEPPTVVPPGGVSVVSLGERPDVVEAMYTVYVEAEGDVPGSVGGRTYEAWRALEVDRPSRSPDLSFVALAGDDVVGYAMLDVLGSDGHHGFTAVRRAWRRRGVATALKHAQIAAATRAGLERLVTSSEERNLPMRRLNERLGYGPDGERSTVVLRGALVSLQL